MRIYAHRRIACLDEETALNVLCSKTLGIEAQAAKKDSERYARLAASARGHEKRAWEMTGNAFGSSARRAF
jgi:hypothetical protein